ANPPAALTTGLAGISEFAVRAQKAFDAGNDAGTVEPIAAGLTRLRQLRGTLGSIGLSDEAQYEGDFRLQIKQKDYERALLAASGLSFEALADDGLVIRGQAVKLTLVTSNRGGAPVAIGDIAIDGFDGSARCAAGQAQPGAVYTCSADAHLPKDARLTTP